MNYLKENVRKLFYLFLDLIIIIAYSSQSKRKNFINEIIEEEDEDKNKEKEKKERKKNGRGKRLNENIYPEEKIAKPVLIWSNSQFNTKTYENIIYKNSIILIEKNY